jgi:RNA polymerase sigma-70 factor (ECF subfamily)
MGRVQAITPAPFARGTERIGPMDAKASRDALSIDLIRAARGEAAALKAVYDKTSAKLFGVCLRILGDRDEAEDVLQEVYLSVWRNAATFDETRASPVTWMATIARNRAIDRLRRRRPERSYPIDSALEVADGAPSALDRLDATEGAARLSYCVGELDSQHRDAIRAAFLDGFTYEALASRAGVPLGTMKSWIRRSLLKLRVCMEQ